MLNKKVLITPTQRKGFLGNSLEHCLKIRDWDQWPNWSYIKTQKFPKSWEFLNLVNFCGTRVYGIFNDLSIPESVFILEKDLWKIFLKHCVWFEKGVLEKYFKKIVFNFYFLFELKKNFKATWFWKRNLTRLGKISLKTT